MKAKNFNIVFQGMWIILCITLFSCGSTEKAAVSCPEFPASRFRVGIHQHNLIQARALNSNFKNRKRTYHASHMAVATKNNPGVTNSVLIPDKDCSQKIFNISLENYVIPDARKQAFAPYLKIHVNAKRYNILKKQQAACDTIVLRTGDLILGKVLEVGQDVIKYRKCENMNGPVFLASNQEVFMIKYPNGTRDFFSPSGQSNSLPDQGQIRTEGLGLAGFISSLVALFILEIPLGLLAIIFGSISLGKQKRYPSKYKGRGFAIASIIIGFIDVIGMIIVLSAM